jgi:hypothetical protein
MAVPVVLPDTDHRHRWRHRVQEGRIRRGRAVVRHRQEVGFEATGVEGQQVGLGRQLDVAGCEHAPTCVGDPHDDRRVVEFAAGPTVRTAGRRVEDLDRHVSEGGDLAGHRGADRDAALPGHLDHLGGLRQLGRDRPVPDRVHPQAPQHVGHPTDMVQVRVGDHDKVEMAAPVATQPGGRGVVFPGVHEDAGVRGLDQERVTLADVDRRDRHRALRHQPVHLREAGSDDRGQGRDREPARRPGSRLGQ